MWVDDPAKWDRVADVLRTAGEFGYDTETYGQPDKTSPQHRAQVHCWSFGILTQQESPRGYRRAVGRVLPAAALFHPAIRAVLEDPAVRKWAHNAPHDQHSTANMGVALAGLQDSLQWFRVAAPGMVDYGLKEIERWALGYGPRPSFLQMVKYQEEEVRQRPRQETRCRCGAVPCRARSIADFCDKDGVWRPHERVKVTEYTEVRRTVEKRYAVTDFVPGAILKPLDLAGTGMTVDGCTTVDRLKAWWDYSAADAVRGIEAVDWLRRRKVSAVPWPWRADVTN